MLMAEAERFPGFGNRYYAEGPERYVGTIEPWLQGSQGHRPPPTNRPLLAGTTSLARRIGAVRTKTLY